jgi:DNA-binding transcriptional LysR family regulator
MNYYGVKCAGGIMKQGLRLLTLDQIRAFVSVCEYGSFTDAARVQSRTQTAVTRQIRAAEDILGEKLLRRSRGHFEGLTEAGERLLPFAHKILATLEDAWLCLEQPGLTGTVRVGVMDDIDMNWLIALIGRFKSRHPECDVRVISDFSVQLEKRLEQRELDIAIVKTLQQQNRQDTHQVLRREPLLWAAGPGFHWRKREPLPLVLFHDGCIYRNHLIQTLETAGIPFKIAYEGQNYSHMRAAVIAGLGVTAVAKSQIDLGGLHILREIGGISLAPLSDVEIAIKTLARRRSHALSGFLQEVMRSTRQEREPLCLIGGAQEKKVAEAVF